MKVLIDFDTPEILTAEKAAIDAALARVMRFADVGIPSTPAWPKEQRFMIHTQPRDRDGWLEFQIVTDTDDAGRFVRGQSMLVGMIQRKPGEAFEFHS